MSAVSLDDPPHVELEIDGEKVRVFEGIDDPRRLPLARPRDPDPLLRRVADAGQRLPGLHGRGGGVARAGRRRARARRRTAWSCTPARTASGTAARWCSSSSPRASTCRRRRTSTAGRPNTVRAPSATARPAPPPRPASGTAHAPATITPVTDRLRRTVAQPVKVDNENYVRDYAKCILCYKCVEACGTDWQNTFAIAVAGRGFDARIATSSRRRCRSRPASIAGTASRCAPPARSCSRASTTCAPTGPGTRPPGRDRDDLLYCGVGCSLELHVQDNEIVKVNFAARPQRHARQPLREGPLRVPVRAEPLTGRGSVSDRQPYDAVTSRLAATTTAHALGAARPMRCCGLRRPSRTPRETGGRRL